MIPTMTIANMEALTPQRVVVNRGAPTMEPTPEWLRRVLRLSEKERLEFSEILERQALMVRLSVCMSCPNWRRVCATNCCRRLESPLSEN